MDFSSVVTGAGKGAAAGMVLGPIGAAAGALLGAAPGLLDALGIHLFGSDGEAVAASAVAAVQAVTGKADPMPGDVAGLSPGGMAQLRVQLAQIAAGREAAGRADVLATLQAQLADIKDARARDVAALQSGKRNVRADMMLVAVTIGLISCIIASATGHLDAMTFGMVSAIAGVLSGCFKDAFGFEFGSSRSSEAKTGIIAGMAASNAEQAALANSAPLR